MRPSTLSAAVDLIHPRRTAWQPGSVNRAGGPPIGVDERTRPQDDGRYFQHLLTVDLDSTPDVRAAAKLDGVRALALFIRDAMENDAYQPGSGETAVVLLTDADLARGEWTGERSTTRRRGRSTCTRSTCRSGRSTTTTPSTTTRRTPASRSGGTCTAR
jgi:hypothetical protein